MYSSGIIVTGLSGFIGSNFVKKNNCEDIYYIDRNSKYFQIKNYKSGKSLNDKNKELILIHLATYFSKDSRDKQKIYDANIEFGKNTIEFLKNYNLSKIIYTNTMYKFYKDKNIRDLYYTKSKIEFSQILEEFCLKNDVLYEEIYLDNTFGKNDKRKKILPIIVNNILEGKENPIKNPNASINLVHIDDVVNQLQKSLKKTKNEKYLFVQKNSIILSSIYEYLFDYFCTKKKTQNLIIKSKNEYIINDNFKNLYDLNFGKIYSQLIRLLR